MRRTRRSQHRQEVGRLCHFVHDTVTAAGVKILSFNAQHLRMIASSRKKTDHRDAYWIAKALQTPDMRDKLLSLGMAGWSMTPEQFAALIRSDIDTFAKVVKAAKVKAE